MSRATEGTAAPAHDLPLDLAAAVRAERVLVHGRLLPPAGHAALDADPLFMLLKAGFIVAIFMHMAWERLALKFAILVPPLVPAGADRLHGDRGRLHLPHPRGGVRQVESRGRGPRDP